MPLIECSLTCNSVSPHLQQLFTGFKMLQDEGVIKVKQKFSKHVQKRNADQYLKDSSRTHLKVDVMVKKKQRVTLFFDTHDAKEIDNIDLIKCDLYFKRSFSQEYISKNHNRNIKKIHPLGFNYLVLPNSIDNLALKRNLILLETLKNKLGGFISAIDSYNKYKFLPRLRNLQALPDYTLSPKVIFIAKAYDPLDVPDRPAIKMEERIDNNNFRGNCIRALRKELGSKFYGGFIPDYYSKRHFKNILLKQPKTSIKKNYLNTMKQFNIGIASKGLHGSNGWKLAEYIAFSKSIVSETLNYQVPGSFQAGRNYLEFHTPLECVEQSINLLTQTELRNQMMTDNFIYYQDYLRPDKIILNALLIAIKKTF